MIPAAFDYVRAGSVDEAIALLAEHGEDAKLIAGGHSLLPMMKLRLAFPSVLIDIRQLPGTSYTRVEGDEIAIGALTRHCDLVSSEVLRAEAPLLAAVAAQVGDPQIRHRGTIGGSISHADPSADLPCAVLASDAKLVLQGPDGRREVAATEFFLGYFDTAMNADELLVELRIPRTGPGGWHYEKFTRRANDWAIVAVATVAGRIGLANMGNRPLRAVAAEAALAAGGTVQDAAAVAAEGTEPIEDMHANSEYRQHLVRVLTQRSLVAAAER
ncbi:MAG: xanthine dehydrogenase family protein subunit M [Actinomycetota bacterium]|nr:xanthine dehydrogenase family protein subunit M [Actinomycetota bacterium]MDQ2958579.1 xanthine dehydrogenase family protein subunit M [Actinomycetota bacterium]